MAAPNPATTTWVPIGPQGGIGPVGPAGAAGAQGIQGPAGSGLPTPVVNGQWIKGSGGASIWSPIVQGDLPANIGARTAYPPNNDLNQITDSGWYNGSAFTNAPDGDGSWLFIYHITHVGGPVWATQICWSMQYDPVRRWERSCIGGPWAPWRRTDTNGTFIQSGYGQWYLGAGSKADIAINFPRAYASNPQVFLQASTSPVGNANGNTYGERDNVDAWLYALNTATFWFTLHNNTNGDYTIGLHWLAAGT